MKDELFIVGVILVALCVVSVSSFQVGKDAMRREAIVASHALWAYDEYGHPKFHWKEKETIIREYMELAK